VIVEDLTQVKDSLIKNFQSNF